LTELILTVGLPCSGKTTWARAQQILDPELVVVCMEDLRGMLHNGVRSDRNEQQTRDVRDLIVRDALWRNRSVIVADTNLHPFVQQLLEGLLWDLPHVGFRLCSFLQVPMSVCLERASDPGEQQVIREMAGRYGLAG
jgi:tRNA uridine 5-carbamoylmethylation protein Kti12